MAMIEIDSKEYADLKIASDKLGSVSVELETLKSKNAELGENLKSQKQVLKSEYTEKLVEATTKAEKLESDLKLFTQTLKIKEWEDINKYLSQIEKDLSEYWQVKTERETARQNDIKVYSDFLNKKDPEYLKSKVWVFGEELLSNDKWLKEFAVSQWYNAQERIKVWTIENKTTWMDWKQNNDFQTALNNGDVAGAREAYLQNFN